MICKDIKHFTRQLTRRAVVRPMPDAEGGRSFLRTRQHVITTATADLADIVGCRISIVRGIP